MQLGMVGLGKMGGAMVRRLVRGGHQCVAFDLNQEAVAQAVEDGARGASSMPELVGALSPPRAVWVMVPAGNATEGVVDTLRNLLQAGDVVIDGGNTFYKDDVRRAHLMAQRSIDYLDCGTSGGVWGEERGYCLMIGGDASPVERLDPIFKCLAPGRGDLPRTPGWEGRPTAAEEGYLHCGPAGAGHFVKMVHNGIEYGLMQAYAEGFDLMASAAGEGVPSELRYEIALDQVAEVWRRGSVVGSWLLDLTARALAENPTLDGFSGHVSDSGEGRWTVQTAVERAVPADVLSAALYARFRSRQDHTFAEKVLSAMRKGFGGHVEPQKV